MVLCSGLYLLATERIAEAYDRVNRQEDLQKHDTGKPQEQLFEFAHP